MKLWHLAVTSCALLVSSSTALADVIVVDSDGRGSFTAIQPAVDAAVDGDVLFVKFGQYSEFTINGKALTIVGEGFRAVMPNYAGRAHVVNLPAGKVVTLARLSTSGVFVSECAGAVRIVDCYLYANVAGYSGIHAQNSPNIAVTDCQVWGSDAWVLQSVGCSATAYPPGHAGIRLSNSAAAIAECIVKGGRGMDGGQFATPGGDGIHVDSTFGATTPSLVYAARSNIQGGNGGHTECFEGCAASGGAGIRVLDELAPTVDSIGWVNDLMVGGGAAGLVLEPPGGPGCVPATQGAMYADTQPFEFSADSLGFSIPVAAREGEFVTATFTGPPGSRVYVNDRLTTTFEAVASWRGVLLAPFAPVGAPMREIKWGVIPASGTLTRTYAVPELPAGEQAQTRFLQAYRIGANGITLGTFRTLTILDSAF
jgi:hypothetical protein